MFVRKLLFVIILIHQASAIPDMIMYLIFHEEIICLQLKLINCNVTYFFIYVCHSLIKYYFLI